MGTTTTLGSWPSYLEAENLNKFWPNMEETRDVGSFLPSPLAWHWVVVWCISNHDHCFSIAASLLSASAVLCPLSGTALVAPLNRPVISIGLGKREGRSRNTLWCGRSVLGWVGKGCPEVLCQLPFVLSGSEVDINLLKYGHCNFVSPRQACIFYDKVLKLFL